MRTELNLSRNHCFRLCIVILKNLLRICQNTPYRSRQKTKLNFCKTQNRKEKTQAELLTKRV